MNKWYCLIMLVLTCGNCIGQNLVPNPSFEDSVACPSGADNIYLAVGWSGYNPSPDYFNSCNTTGTTDVPDNYIGYQYAATGTAYAGVVTFYADHTGREYLGCQLLDTLVVGTKYFVSMKISLAETLGGAYLIPCNKFGAKFSTVPYSYNSNTCPLMNNFAHIYSNRIISDTLNWTTIQGSFIADSNYNYIVIGNFFDDGNTDTIYNSVGIYSYYFVDDVSVTADSSPCPSMFLVYSITDATPGLNDGAVKVNVSGGQPPYLYSLDSITFQSSSTFTSLDTGTYDVFVTDSNGCLAQGTFAVTYDTTVSIQNINSLNFIRVFPNPFSDELIIELNKAGSVSLKLIDILGRVVLVSQHENASTIKLNVNQIPQGVYYLEVLSNKGEKLHTTGVQIKAG